MCRKLQLVWRIFAFFNWKNELYSRFFLIAENRAWFCHIIANIQKNIAKESRPDINETFVTSLLIFWQSLGSWFDSNLEILAIIVNFTKILKSNFSSYLLNSSRISSDKASKLWNFADLYTKWKPRKFGGLSLFLSWWAIATKWLNCVWSLQTPRKKRFLIASRRQLHH